MCHRMFDYQSLKKYLFKLDPETTHNIAEYALRTAKHFPFCLNLIKRKNLITNDRLKQNIFSKDFTNPIGLAAGFDKNGTMIETMPALGWVGSPFPKLLKQNTFGQQPVETRPLIFYFLRLRGWQD